MPIVVTMVKCYVLHKIADTQESKKEAKGNSEDEESSRYVVRHLQIFLFTS